MHSRANFAMLHDVDSAVAFSNAYRWHGGMLDDDHARRNSPLRRHGRTRAIRERPQQNSPLMTESSVNSGLANLAKEG